MFDKKKWDEYYKTTDGYKKWLKESGEKRRIRYNSDPEFKERVKRQDNRRRRRLKNLVFTHYSLKGYPCCVDCGMYDLRCLSIDHIDGGGTQHRKELKKVGVNFHAWLKKQGLPEGYDTVCMNCNFRRRYNY